MDALRIELRVGCAKCSKSNRDEPIFIFALEGELKGYCLPHYEEYKTSVIVKTLVMDKVTRS